MNEISSRYNPKEVEDKWYKFWEENSYFCAKVNPSKPPFSIVIPPPNVTGILHMGHALNNTIQDILIRYHRMKGFESLWMPGTDHAGIATQNVVEKAIAKEGLKRQDLGREKFIERVWLWKERYGSTIIRQLKKIGASCDWARERFTMDAEYSKAVTEAFVVLYQKGLIYQGNYIINWCPRCQTALSDEEAPYKQLQGSLYYISYPLKEVNGLSGKRVRGLGEKPANRTTGQPASYIVVATTRPETILGDTAVAVNPKDKRYKNLIGKTVILPLVNREIKIIADEMVDMKFGTGAVKVTPAHDPNDYLLGKKHNLEFINIMSPNGRMNEFAGDYKDYDRFEVREVILEDLKQAGLLERQEPHSLSAGHCYRCHTIIEPYLSKQWFVKMKPLAKPAVSAVRQGKIKFYPNRWEKVYLNWMENIQDWCISRQIWWGHRIPVFYCKDCKKQECDSTVNSRESTEKTKSVDSGQWTVDQRGIIVSRIKPDKCPVCGSGDVYQDEDVLDTWFSSWLWPFATFGWPFEKVHSPQSTVYNEDDLKYFYPTSVLVTAPEIIFFWVARMIMAGFEFIGDIPFKDVYIHGTVRDVEGKKMSKSLGNIIDPLEIINEYGTDALRFSLVSITAQGQDVFLSKERFEQGRNFANKIWNASRLILMNLDPALIKTDLCVFFEKQELDIFNRWILSRFYSVLVKLNKAIDNFEFNEAANMLYGFFWHEFCDWYLEIIKPDMKNPSNQAAMFKILEKFLRILHPFMPFITEEIWQKFQAEENVSKKSIMVEPWPHIQEKIIGKNLEKEIEAIFELIRTIRKLKTLIEIESEEVFVVFYKAHNKVISDFMESNFSVIAPVIMRLEKLHDLRYNDNPKAIAAISIATNEFAISLRFTGAFDPAIIKNKIKDKIDKLIIIVKAKKLRLENQEFLKKAPADVVSKEKESMQNLMLELEELKGIFNGLS